jgi:hypothetical protein
MIKDTQQKLKAVRYCVALDIVPYLEVVVRFAGDTAKTPTDITDVDVLGIQPAASLPGRKIFFDCKSGQKMSAINRALWAGGLRSMIKADEGFVILAKSAPPGHRLAGNSIGVRVFAEKLFDAFALAASKDYALQSSYMEQIAAWDALAKIREHFPPLRDLVIFLCSQAPLEDSPVAGLRSLVAQLKRVEGELDPSKAQHRALFFLLVAQALVYLSAMARTYHNVFDPSDGLPEFEESLRFFVWGGKEAYELRQRLNVAIQSARGVEKAAVFDFPGWANFLEMFRSFLDAPFTLAPTCLPLKDMAFRELSTVDPQIDARLAKRLQANNRVRQYAMATANYLVSASRLPREFRDHLTTTLSSVSAGNP